MILGTRGIPARHGGFETFAEDLSLYLVGRNHQVTVYCQTESDSEPCADEWQGVRRVCIPAGDSPAGTVKFDWNATRHASRQAGVVLTLGYNTGVFSLLYRLRHLPNVMNMDGIEWQREKWSIPQRSWLRFNEWASARFANHLVADHPSISAHLQRHTPAYKISVIPYGADAVLSAPQAPLEAFNLRPNGYNLLIARAEPENSILEIVQASSASCLSRPLVVLGNYAEKYPFHQKVKRAAGSNILFLGAIFDREIVHALRFHASAYIHGHQVGGTNPSLVESLAAGNAIVAHDNRFNRWVAGKGARFFTSREDLTEILRSLEESPDQLVEMREASRRRHQEEFTQERVMQAYEEVLQQVAENARLGVRNAVRTSQVGNWY